MSSRQDKIEFLMGRNECTSEGSFFMFHYPVCTCPTPTAPPAPHLPAHHCLVWVILPAARVHLSSFDPVPLLASPDFPLWTQTLDMPWQHSGICVVLNPSVCYLQQVPASQSSLSGCVFPPWLLPCSSGHRGQERWYFIPALAHSCAA